MSEDIKNNLLRVLAALGLFASGTAVGTQVVPSTPASPAAVNRVCPPTWTQTDGSDPAKRAIDASGNGLSQFIVCERDGVVISIFANGTITGMDAYGNRLTDPRATLDAAR